MVHARTPELVNLRWMHTIGDQAVVTDEYVLNYRNFISNDRAPLPTLPMLLSQPELKILGMEHVNNNIVFNTRPSLIGPALPKAFLAISQQNDNIQSSIHDRSAAKTFPFWLW